MVCEKFLSISHRIFPGFCVQKQQKQNHVVSALRDHLSCWPLTSSGGHLALFVCAHMHRMLRPVHQRLCQNK